MEIPKYNLVLTFNTTAKAKSTLTIYDVDPQLKKDAVGKLMDLIIQKNIFITKSGELISKVSAKLIESAAIEYSIK